MPEGPEVKIITEAIQHGLKCTILTDISLNAKSRYKTLDKLMGSNIERIQHMQVALQGGIRLNSVWCKGKKIIFDFEPTMWIVSFLAMSGKWLWVENNHSGICLTFSSDGTQQKLWFDDSRHMGQMEIFFNKPTFVDRMNKIGYDLLSYNVGVPKNIWFSVIRAPRRKNMEICRLLMKQEQTYFAGIGNYLKSEILYRARIKPTRKLSDLSDEDVERLRMVTIATMWESYQNRGCTFKDFWDTEGRKGLFKCLVYKQNVDAYGNKVIKECFSDGRTSHWVPEIQI